MQEKSPNIKNEETCRLVGDVIAFDFRTLHDTTAGKVQGRRRALSTRWL